MSNEISRSDFAFKIMSFVKNKVTKNMIIIEMNRGSNDPNCFSCVTKLSQVTYVINDISLKINFFKKYETMIIIEIRRENNDVKIFLP